MRTLLAGAVFLPLLLLGACDQCLGTPACTSAPEVSTSGQFIERTTGRPVGGVLITFHRESGVEFAAGIPSATSGADGFFVLRAPALQEGVATGELRVTPPAPHLPYSIQNAELWTNRVRGDGRILGRLVVDPYLFLIGHVRDRNTLAPIVGAQVVVRRVGGARLQPEMGEFVTDHGGQFGWQPTVLDQQPVEAEFEITVAGHPRPYSIQRTLALSYRDPEFTFVILPAGWGFSYVAQALRRGSNVALPGVTVELRRVSGISTDPTQVTVPTDANGTFSVPFEPLEEGTLTAEIRVVPPPPIPAETSLATLRTTDDDQLEFLGIFRYGSQLFATATFTFADDGQPIPAGTAVEVRRTAGPTFDSESSSAQTIPGSVGSDGRLSIQAPTSDSGAIELRFVVQLPEPLAWDTIPGVTAPARYSDAQVDLGSITVRRRPRP